jgi:hypothetical protein
VITNLPNGSAPRRLIGFGGSRLISALNGSKTIPIPIPPAARMIPNSAANNTPATPIAKPCKNRICGTSLAIDQKVIADSSSSNRLVESAIASR